MFFVVQSKGALSQVGLGELVLEAVACSNAAVRQAAFGLVGDLARHCCELLPGPRLLQPIVDALYGSNVNLCMNASWALGELAARVSVPKGKKEREKGGKESHLLCFLFLQRLRKRRLLVFAACCVVITTLGCFEMWPLLFVVLLLCVLLSLPASFTKLARTLSRLFFQSRWSFFFFFFVVVCFCCSPSQRTNRVLIERPLM